MKKIILTIVVIILVLGIWLPVVPFPVARGWHGIHSEWCGIVLTPDCEKTTIKFLTYIEIKDVIQNHAY